MLNEYVTYLQEKGASPNTIISYTNDLNIFFNDLHIRPSDYVTPADIRKWIHQMLNPAEGKPLAISTINRRLNSLRSFYAWAVEHHKIEQNPMKDIQDLKSADEDNEKIMWLTEEEFEDLLHRMRKKPVQSRGVDPEEKYRRDRAVVYLLTYAGFRVEELSNLKLTDLDLEMKRIRIVGKGMKVRTVPISNILLAELEDWLKFRAEMAKKKPHVAESPYVFYSQRSPKFSVRGIQRMIDSYSLPNKKLTPHMFRHTFCKWMLKATNNDIEKVRRLAGHSNIATTSRYLKDSYSDLADAVEALPKF
ncbi:tyrosine-type recombinase/integrase [Geobacillus stearothermophilus]|uniref:tyrosine-type recombinase/integrase n=1 Tax=Geobacillus stearothermophilus TaxID=1422 RepID=UPI0006AC6B6E|nr:tyrosine-type recombinase/integrase [Geobacillus stearothermophilus]KOR92064.1 integrase [Geobacillus stearothermophilus ATCC 12980]MED4880725.1 tyrosine-type recombinase/integrase [Geobacillus stearothermophilus]MED5010682.1 tyrosine-type recombinase/integrase [Geobacillus stearothermophilus]MED5014883.1 tyrosine-type recombinase/integrase [Geobacillus stearothermophilus]MED5044822.1 tyrosine-type recombinase/integrase [Geobacillus stearothermophilus]